MEDSISKPVSKEDVIAVLQRYLPSWRPPRVKSGPQKESVET